MKLMLPALVVVALAATACPDRKETIDTVGGAPKAQVDIAKERLEKAEDKLGARAAEAAVTE